MCNNNSPPTANPTRTRFKPSSSSDERFQFWLQLRLQIQVHSGPHGDRDAVVPAHIGELPADPEGEAGRKGRCRVLGV